MPNTIEQYREAKANYLKLRNQAKKELIARFHVLAGELLQLQRELLEDFGEKIAIPKSAKRPRVAKLAVAAAAPAPAAPPSPKVAALEKQLDRQKKKLADTKTAGKPTKAIEDRIYEIEDEIRLLKEV
jgi:hypothetical protein